MSGELTITARRASLISTAQSSIIEAPKIFQLELIGTECDDRLDKKSASGTPLRCTNSTREVEFSKNFYEPTKIDAVNGLSIMDAAEKQRLEEKQIELCAGRE
jgi:hypothetical protein